jgi:hypothetical protein
MLELRRTENPTLDRVHHPQGIHRLLTRRPGNRLGTLVASDLVDMVPVIAILICRVVYHWVLVRLLLYSVGLQPVEGLARLMCCDGLM